MTALLGAGKLDDTRDALVFLSFSDPGWAVFIGRLLNSLASTLSVALVYLLGSCAFGRRSGLVGALFFALSATAVQQAHRALPDTVMALFATLCIYASWRLYRTGWWRHYAMAGVMAGLMVSTKYNGAFVSFGLVAAHALRSFQLDRVRLSDAVFSAKLWMAVALALVALVTGTPYLVLAWKPYLSVVNYQTSSLAFSMAQTDSWLWIPRAYLTDEYVLGALMLGGLALAIVRRHPLDWIVLAGWVPSFLYIGTWTRESLHYLLQFHPVLALMAARLVLSLWDYGNAQTNPKTTAGRGAAIDYVQARRGLFMGGIAVALVASVLISNGSRVVAADRELTRPDTRALAGQWIETNVPAGSSIAMTWLPYCPRVDLISARASILRYVADHDEMRQALQERWQTRPAYQFVNLEAWLRQPVVPHPYRDHVDLSDPETRRVFSRGWRSIDRLRRDGVQWVVLPEAV